MWLVWLIIFILLLNMFSSEPTETFVWMLKCVFNIILFIFFVWLLTWVLSLFTDNGALIMSGVVIGIFSYCLILSESR